MKISVAIEISEETSLKTKVSLGSFLENNQWFDGTVYLLTSSKFPVSEKTFAEISSIYSNLERINVNSDERINRLMSSNGLLTSSLLSHLKLGTFLIDDTVLYISQKSLFLSDVSFFMEAETAAVSAAFLHDTSSIFYLSSSLDKDQLLSSICQFVLDETQVPPNKRLNSAFSNEFKRIPKLTSFSTDRVVSAVNFLDRYFTKLKSSLLQISCIHFDDSVFNGPLYTKINQIWLQKARTVTLLVNRPSSNRKLTSRPPAKTVPQFKDNAFSISIIIPAFKAMAYIKECLDSIKNQKTSAKIEILVGIDNCKDTLSSIESIMGDYPNLRIFFSQKSIGAYIMRNSLVDFAKHDNLLFFDADDIMTPNMVMTILQKYNRSRPIRFKYLNFTHGNDHTRQHTINSKVSHGVFFIPRRLFESIGGFQNWPCGADTDFMKRCLHNRVSDINLNLPLFYRRVHPASLTQNPSTGYASKTRAQIANIIKNTRVWTIPIPRVVSKLEKIK